MNSLAKQLKAWTAGSAVQVEDTAVAPKQEDAPTLELEPEVPATVKAYLIDGVYVDPEISSQRSANELSRRLASATKAYALYTDGRRVELD